jgi:hypothetical protein
METLTYIFWNRQEHRIRAFWRLLVLAGVLVAITLAVIFVFGLLLGAAVALMALPVDSLLTFEVIGLMNSVLLLFVIMGSMWLTGRLIDRRPFAEFGLHLNKNWWLDLGFGLVLGALLMAGVFLTELAMGWISITDTFVTTGSGQSFALAILVPVVIFLGVGIQEELLVRGYILQNIAEGFNLRPVGARGAIILAWLLSSLIFGVMHILNPNTTIISTVNLSLAGIFLGLAYVLTGELGIPIGLHITWNLFQGSVFGFPVSGQDFTQTTFIAIEQGGPELWTGGAYGPEAGLIGIAAMLVGCGLIILWVRVRYGHIGFHLPLAQSPTWSAEENAHMSHEGQAEPQDMDRVYY